MGHARESPPSASAVCGGEALCGRGKPRPTEGTLCAAIQPGVVALLLVSPHSQVYTFVWALIPLLVLGVRLLDAGAGWGRWLAFVAAYVLLGRNMMRLPAGV